VSHIGIIDPIVFDSNYTRGFEDMFASSIGVVKTLVYYQQRDSDVLLSGTAKGCLTMFKGSAKNWVDADNIQVDSGINSLEMNPAQTEVLSTFWSILTAVVRLMCIRVPRRSVNKEFLISLTSRR